MRFLNSLLIGLAFCRPAFGYSVLAPEELSMEYYKIDDMRDSYWDSIHEHWLYGVAVNFNFNFVEFDSWKLYWHNHAHMAATEQQVRQAGWQFEFGLNIYNKVEIFDYHHSQHLLERGADATRQYPLDNMYGVRLIILRK